MIAYIKGILTHKTPTEVVVEANGVGYLLLITLNTYTRLESMSEATLLTHLVIREDAHTLYGFVEDSERQMFLHLIGVSGVGPNTARLLLSSIPPAELKGAIIAENEIVLHKVKGIGPKSAKRIILELKDKMLKDGSIEESSAPTLALGSGNKVREEALSALVALGFQKIPAQKALNAALKQDASLVEVEKLLKAALKLLS